MKKKSILLFATFLVTLLACQNDNELLDTNKQVEAISIGYDSGFNFGDIILGSDSIVFGKTLVQNGFQKYQNSSSPPKNIIVRRDALNYLAKYTLKNCNTFINNYNAANFYFTINTFTGSGYQRCYLYLQDGSVQNYFTEMLEYINQSQYKADFKELIPSLELYVENSKKKR